MMGVAVDGGGKLMSTTEFRTSSYVVANIAL